MIQAHIDHNPTDVVLSLDITNGFNSLHRHAMLGSLYSCDALRGLWRLADWCYGGPSDLVVSSRSHFDIIASARGARQGCPLGTLLFALSLQPVLQHMVNGLTGLTLAAIVDDITIAGPPDKVAIALARAQELLPDLGLRISPAKSSLFWPSQLPPCRFLSCLLLPPRSQEECASSFGLRGWLSP